MTETTLAIGATARWGDGASGELRSLVIGQRGYDAWPVTHLVVKPSRPGPDRLVPFDRLGPVDVAAGELTLRCTDAEFEDLSAAVVLPGEAEEDTGDRVYAVDGAIGYLRALVVDRGLGNVLAVRLTGHPWGRDDLAIPVGEVADFDGGVHLGISKREARHLTSLGPE